MGGRWRGTWEVNGDLSLITVNMILLLILPLLPDCSSLEITPYLPPGLTRTSTVTTTDQDFDNERFSLVTPSNVEDSGYDFRLKFEQTVHPINPTILTSLIHMTEPRYVAGNPLTVGLLDKQFDESEKYYV